MVHIFLPSPFQTKKIITMELTVTAALRHHPKPTKLFQQVNQLCTQNRISDAVNLAVSSPKPDVDSVGIILQSCGSNRDIKSGKKIHEFISGNEVLNKHVVVTTKLVTMYGMCGNVLDSRRVFDSMEEKNLYQWNSMISCYARNGFFHESISLFLDFLVESDLKPDDFTLPSVFKSCGVILDFEFGKQVHGMSLKLGLSLKDSFVCSALMSMYGKYGLVYDALKVFDRIPKRNLVSWNTILGVFNENGFYKQCYDLFITMLENENNEEIKPDEATIVTFLPVCTAEGNIKIGKIIHGLSVKLGLNHSIKVNSALINMYSKNGHLLEADRLFSYGNEFKRSLVMWNSMIGGYTRNGDVIKSFNLIRSLNSTKFNLKADEITILNILPVCLSPEELRKLKEIHCFIIRNELENKNELIRNALVAAYAKCGFLEYAIRVFDSSEEKSVSLFNALIGGFAQNGESLNAIQLFHEMIGTGLVPDYYTIASLLLACGNINNDLYCKSIHGFILRNGFERDSFITISLLSVYVQLKDEYMARVLFELIEEKDIISWNVIIGAYAQNGNPNETLNLYRKMLIYFDNKPSIISTISALMACADLSIPRLGKEIHSFALKYNYINDAFISSSIIDMYAKCGFLEESRSFFDRIIHKDSVHWNVMINCYGLNGFGKEAINIYKDMKKLGFVQDEYTYIGLLLACNHGGMVKQGLKYFEEMKMEYDLEPKLEHYSCVIDMLGRAGKLNDALKMLNEMPEKPDEKILSSLLNSCKIHGDLVLGERVFKKLLELEPEKSEHYVLISNFYASFGKWDEVKKIRAKIDKYGLYKDPGFSWIEIGGKIFSFLAGDNEGLIFEMEEIRVFWRNLEEKIREIGYLPDSSVVLHDINEEEKLEKLRGHSEKLAISFGLLRSKRAVKKIRVFKNVRMCRDCHNAIKCVSKVVKKEIVVRDNKRFHHFKDGFCSCGDFW